MCKTYQLAEDSVNVIYRGMTLPVTGEPLRYCFCMAINSSLVPTVITDINGKTTTVHKKPTSTKVSSPRLPAPVLSGARKPSRAELTEQALKELAKHSVPTTGTLSADMMRDSLNGCSDSFLQRMGSLIDGDNRIAYGIAEQLVADEPEQDIVECAHFYKLLDIPLYRKAQSLIKSVTQYEAFSVHDDLSKADDEVQAQCLAVMHATLIVDAECDLAKDDPSHPLEHLNTSSPWPWLLFKDEALVDLIRERPQDAEKIARVAARHHTSDPNTVLGIMNGVTPALAEGSL
jgi:hypothetical protein